MSDVWESILYEASYGGVRLDVLSVDGQAGRSVVRHSYPNRDGANIEDMGRDVRVESVKAIFFGPDHRDRFVAFVAQKDRGEALPFVHPLFGEMTRARVTNFSYSIAAEPRETIYADITFEEDTTTPSAFDAGAGTPIMAGVDAVTASAAEFNSAALAIGLVSTVADDAVIVADGWATTAKTARDIQNELNDASTQIQAAIDEWELATDIAAYPVVAAASNLMANLRNAAASVLATTPRLMSVTVTAPLPLRCLIAQTYPTAEWEDRTTEAMALNDIPDPTRLEPGSITLPMPSSARSAG
jgi:prophage DNA circulation protein